MSSKSNEVLKVCLDRSQRKRKFHRLIVQLRFDFYYGCHSHIHGGSFILGGEERTKSYQGAGSPPTITRRETRLDEARLQPRAALIEPIKISAFSNRERERKRSLDSREDPRCLSVTANAVARLEETSCRRERLERREPTGIG